jgi:hypothetical protein
LEHRDGSKQGDPRKSFKHWYNGQKGWTMGTNYYVKTFVGEKDSIIPKNFKGDFYWTYSKYQKRALTLPMFMDALTNLRKFNLILVTEWMSSSNRLIETVLGWKIPPKQVLPHEVQVCPYYVSWNSHFQGAHRYTGNEIKQDKCSC